jgi:hypothetical protein
VSEDVCEAATAEIVWLILKLEFTNTAIDYANGARVREELEHSLRNAQQTAEGMPEGPARIDMLRRLDGLRALADRELAIAPTPSTAAIAAVKAGDSSMWLRETDEWATERLGHGSSHRPPRRARSDTRPESPAALRAEPLDADHATTHRLHDKAGRP